MSSYGSNPYNYNRERATTGTLLVVLVQEVRNTIFNSLDVSCRYLFVWGFEHQGGVKILAFV